MPSHAASTAPSTHPTIACGPPIAPISSGSVMNGPTPIMSSRFSVTAPRSVSVRSSLCSPPFISVSLCTRTHSHRQISLTHVPFHPSAHIQTRETATDGRTHHHSAPGTASSRAPPLHLQAHSLALHGPRRALRLHHHRALPRLRL